MPYTLRVATRHRPGRRGGRVEQGRGAKPSRSRLVAAMVANSPSLLRRGRTTTWPLPLRRLPLLLLVLLLWLLRLLLLLLRGALLLLLPDQSRHLVVLL